MIGIIYVTVNLIDGKKYIGQHKCRRETDSYLGSGKILKRAIEKYGRENFKRYTLYKAETEEELDEKEIAFISAFRATEKDNYYNVAEGGLTNRTLRGKNNPYYGVTGSAHPCYGRKHTEDELRRMSESQKGKIVIISEETKKKISETSKKRGNKPCALAYERLKGKKGYAHAGRPHSHIFCPETGKVYESINEASRQLGVYAANIGKVLNGIRKTTGGYHFEKTNLEVTSK